MLPNCSTTVGISDYSVGFFRDPVTPVAAMLRDARTTEMREPLPGFDQIVDGGFRAGCAS